jgi:hypothetical protein
VIPASVTSEMTQIVRVLSKALSISKKMAANVPRELRSMVCVDT